MKSRDLRPQPKDAPPRSVPAVITPWLFALGLIAGIVLGIALARALAPWQRMNAEPWQLRPQDRNHYMMAIALEYANHQDISTALDKLIALKPAGDPLQQLAEATCALGSRGYLGSPAGIKTARIAIALYSAQGRQGCAEQLLPPAQDDPAARPEPPPPEQPRATLLPTKRPLSQAPLASPSPRSLPALPESRNFELLSQRSFCDLRRPALIEVYVVDYLGRGIPGQRIRARWGDQEDFFVSGLKAERGDGYADFQMEAGIDYAIDMAGADDGQGASLRAGDCYTENRRTLKSYRVTFVER